MVEQLPDLDRIFGALADPTRRKLLELLARGEQRVTDLAKPFRMTLAAVSKHLKVLERAGLLVRRRDGRVHHMRANPQAVADAKEWLAMYIAGWEQSLDSLDRYLAETHGPPSTPDGDDDPSPNAT